jgi:putative spermidine/putrescine transport system permease protein
MAADEMGVAGRQTLRALALLSPAAVLQALLLIVPMTLVLPMAFDAPLAGTIGLRGDWTLANFTRLAGRPLYQASFMNSLISSLLVVACSISIGFAVAWMIARQTDPRKLNFMILGVLASMQVDLVLRIFGLIALMGDAGTINRTLGHFGLSPLPLMYNTFGVVAGLSQVSIPIVALALIGPLRQLDPAQIEVARSLGAGTARILRTIVFPWAAPALLGTGILVFALAISSYIVPALMGGGRMPTLAVQLYSQVMGAGSWQFGAAIATLLFVVANLAMLANVRLAGSDRQ